MAMHVRGILFDIDDTLVDTKGAFRHALASVTVQHLRPGTNADEVSTFWRQDRGGWYRAYTRGELSHRDQRMRRANDLHAQFGGVAMDDAAYDLWDTEFERCFQEGWRAHVDAVPVLDQLDALGVPYGAVSNSAFAYQAMKLSTVGLDRVTMLVGVDTFGVGKPDPRVFLEGARLLGLDPSEVAYVGDERDIDSVAAIAAGLTGVWIDREASSSAGDEATGERADGVLRVTSLGDLVAGLGERSPAR